MREPGNRNERCWQMGWRMRRNPETNGANSQVIVCIYVSLIDCLNYFPNSLQNVEMNYKTRKNSFLKRNIEQLLLNYNEQFTITINNYYAIESS